VTSAKASKQRVVSGPAWVRARKALLLKEKKFNRVRDALARERRKLPWEKVEKEYIFETEQGAETLAQLFGTKSQLVVYHFMFNPAAESGCKHCSFWADNFDGIDIHLAHRDVNFLAISRASLSKIRAFKKRMGWTFTWVSSAGNDFNFDYGVSFRPEDLRSGKASYNYARVKSEMGDREGVSVFARDPSGQIFHTYSTYARGIDMLNGAYNFLDLVPKGRGEEGGPPQQWVRHHDRYES